jgi:hypothetical protein
MPIAVFHALAPLKMGDLKFGCLFPAQPAAQEDPEQRPISLALERVGVKRLSEVEYVTIPVGWRRCTSYFPAQNSVLILNQLSAHGGKNGKLPDSGPTGQSNG